MKMTRQPVRSSNIASIGYEPSSQTLEIEFHSRTVYQYYMVTQKLYEDFMRASSHGTFFHEHIKGRYGDKKVS